MKLNNDQEIRDFIEFTRKPNEPPNGFDDRFSFDEAIAIAKARGPEGAKLLEALIEFGNKA